MNVKEIIMSNDIKNLNIYPISDVHYGSSQCSSYEFLKYIKTIEKDPDAIAFIMGDLFECNSVENINEQVQRMARVLMPIKDKIAVIVYGNHELKFKSKTDIDVIIDLAVEMDLDPDIIFEDGVYLFLQFGNTKAHDNRPLCYQLYVTHGAGKAKTTGGKVDSLVDRAKNIPTADIVIGGHFHTPFSVRENIPRVDESNRKIQYKDRLIVESNSWLEYGGYAERAGFPPTSLTPPIISLNGYGKKAFHCSL